ncbi:chemotaxis protein [Bacillus circulans]|jgi:methyl-accepting chemotaxis protein|uniref:methyl-accepting chemotaxis protein n=1 Tax=unclassified Niallia TaxID=2837522 RepID=UPI0013D67C17|nr:chemotaxis protein [Niallia circulans]QJX63860.1 chemotaxis protein [Niallia circulans]
MEEVCYYSKVILTDWSAASVIKQVESLEDIIPIVPIIKAAIPADLSIAICDKEKFIAYFPGEIINLHIKTNQPLQSDEPLREAIQLKKTLKQEVPADFYGFEFIGTASPILNKKGEVIGGIAVQLKRQTEIRNIVDQITKSLTQSQKHIDHIADGSHSLVDFSKILLEQSSVAEENIRKTNEVVSIIKKVADQTNLLGLNAAIEAARAGEKGRGFEVVANEIRKFSKETVSFTQTISQTMEQIKQTTQSINESIGKIAAIGEKQADSIEHTSVFMEEILEMAKKLNDYSNKL